MKADFPVLLPKGSTLFHSNSVLFETACSSSFYRYKFLPHFLKLFILSGFSQKKIDLLENAVFDSRALRC